jgi:23S rRNA-/tRNA-specific pseudouridylate synthase
VKYDTAIELEQTLTHRTRLTVLYLERIFLVDQLTCDSIEGFLVQAKTLQYHHQNSTMTKQRWSHVKTYVAFLA